MFGEETITLEKAIKLDEKGRIRIPSGTKVVAEEPIGMLYSINQDRLLLYSGQEYEMMLTKILAILERKKKSGKYDAKFLRTLQRKIFGEYCFSPEKTDKALRLPLPDRAVKTLELQTMVYVVGVNNHLELFKDEQSYRMALNRRN